MANLSKLKRDQMIEFLECLKKQHKDDDKTLSALNEIQTKLTEKKYGLVWEEHTEQVDEEMKTKIPVFTLDSAKSIKTSDSSDCNFLLEGDNLHSLTLLEKTHKGKIDVIYIDPPYNTGNNDFVYEDKMISSDDSYKHSKWLSFMYRRLKIASKLLSENGVIFISINDVEQSQLKLLCDEIFDERNFINNISVELSPSSGVKRSHKDKGFIKNKESILIYKNKKLVISPLYDEWKEFDNHYSIYFDGKKYTSLLAQIREKFPKYKNINNKMFMFYDDVFDFIIKESQNIYRTHDASKWALEQVNQSKAIFSDNKNLIKKVTNPDNHDEYELLKKKQSGSFDRLEPLSWNVVDGKIVTLRGDLWLDFDKDMGNVSKEGDVKFPNGKKPVRLLKDIIKCCSTKNSIVLDFFAGSGTAGQSVLELNKEDGGNRKFILCTNNQNNICENITYKRILNCATGYKGVEGMPTNLLYYKTNFVPKDSDKLCQNLNEHIKEMIQLEIGKIITDEEYPIILLDDDADELESNVAKYKDIKNIYIANDVMLTAKQKKIFGKYEIKIIPENFFEFELREQGEIF